MQERQANPISYDDSVSTHRPAANNALNKRAPSGAGASGHRLLERTP